MSDITDALNQLGILMQSVDPSPSEAPKTERIFVYPRDYEKIVYDPDEYPFIIASQFIFGQSQTKTWGIGGGSFQHNWTAVIDVFLGKAPVNGKDIIEFGARLELLQHPWPAAIETAIINDLTLNGTVDQIGNDRNYFIGPIAWRNIFTAWGIRYLLPIQTTIQTC